MRMTTTPGLDPTLTPLVQALMARGVPGRHPAMTPPGWTPATVRPVEAAETMPGGYPAIEPLVQVLAAAPEDRSGLFDRAPDALAEHIVGPAMEHVVNPLAEALAASGPPARALGSGRPVSAETYLGAAGSGFNEGLARALGYPVDWIAALIRSIPGADEVMPKDAFGGAAGIRNLLNALGIITGPDAYREALGRAPTDGEAMTNRIAEEVGAVAPFAAAPLALIRAGLAGRGAPLPRGISMPGHAAAQARPRPRTPPPAPPPASMPEPPTPDPQALAGPPPLDPVREAAAEAEPAATARAGAGRPAVAQGSERYGWLDNGMEVVRLADGSPVLGYIESDAANYADGPAGPIYLERGWDDPAVREANRAAGRQGPAAAPDGMGETHIEARHGDEIRALTDEDGNPLYADAAELVADVAATYTRIAKGHSGRLIIGKTNGRETVAVVELVRNGSGWTVVTAGLRNKGWMDSPQRSVPWRRAEQPAARGLSSPEAQGTPRHIVPNVARINGPDDIDAAPGRALLRRLRRSLRRSPAIAAREAADILAAPAALEALTTEWRRWRRVPFGRGRQAEAIEVGALSPTVIDALHLRHGIEAANAAVTLTRRELRHMTRSVKRDRGAALDAADLDRLPEVIAQPEAVLFDTQAPALLYVFQPANPATADARGKVVLRVNYSDQLKIGDAPRGTVTTNGIRTAGYVPVTNLRASRYDVIDGAME